jgi:hypothetical protein
LHDCRTGSVGTRAELETSGAASDESVASVWKNASVPLLSSTMASGAGLRLVSADAVTPGAATTTRATSAGMHAAFRFIENPFWEFAFAADGCAELEQPAAPETASTRSVTITPFLRVFTRVTPALITWFSHQHMP